jgi:pSer/pThr/pTyr-binding forkhead associated (FHA) protein
MERIGEDIPVLVGQTGPLNGQRWMLRKNITVGRDVTCEIMIPNRQVSRRHATFIVSPEGVRLEDLGSKNGTHLNGQILESSALLKDGDIVQIALAQQFTFLSSDATLPLEYSVDIESSGEMHGRLRLEKRSRQVWVGNEEVIPPLSVSQFQLLEILCENQGKVVTRREVIQKIWGEENAFEVSEQALDALVRRLRDRLASLDPNYAYITTVRGHGLRLDNPPI